MKRFSSHSAVRRGHALWGGILRRMPQTRLIPRWIWAVFFIAVLGFIFSLGIFAAWASVVAIPSIDNFENRKVAQSTKIYDRTGNVVLYDVHGSVRRSTVPLAEVSPYIQKATVAIEDDQFYQHNGFRPTAFLRAVLVNLRLREGYRGQGGSTITQQVVKNALLTGNKTIWRKLEEIILALRLERIYSKDQILESYLNEIGYGGTVYGVQEASQYFFGVDAKDVDLAQAAYLAAVPQAPTHLSPYGNHRDELEARKNLVLEKMKENNFITNAEYTQAKNEEVQFRNELEAGIKAPHFVFYIRDYLELKYGPDVVENDGLKVVTTLDYDLQQKAEAAVAKYAPQMLSNFNASNEGIVAVDPKTGQILAMVGSKGYFDKTIDGAVNVTISSRQPGSSFKPFVYATVFEKGYTPDTVVFDLKTQFSTACQPQDILNDTPPCYSPDNFDGNFKGPMTLRNALAQSENIPAVKTVYLAGVKDSIKTARDMGITTLGNADQYGLTLVLGGGEVTLLEMTGAYSVFANDGVKNPPTGILRVEDKNGNVLENYEDNSTQVIDPQVARQINDILSDNVARTPEFGADSPLYFPTYNVADKTGTTNDFHDVWIIGYTPGIAVGAWAGNNNNTPMAKRIAAFIIAPMWHEFMTAALDKYSSDNFTPPDPDTGLESVALALRGEWNGNPAMGVHDILFWVNKDNPRGTPPSNPFGDAQAAYWDYPVQLWVQGVGASMINAIPGVTPGSPVSGVSPGLIITSPGNGTVVPWGISITAAISLPAGTQASQVSYYLNGGLVGVTSNPPFSLLFQPDRHGGAILRAVAQTPTGLIEGSASFIIQ